MKNDFHFIEKSSFRSQVIQLFLAVNYMFKFNNRNSRKKCKICSKLTVKISERHQRRRSGVFIVNVEHMSHLFSVSIVNFE